MTYQIVEELPRNLPNDLRLRILGKISNLGGYIQSWTKGWRQIDEIKQNGFFYGMVCS